jgi:hypothetical protein
VTLTRAGCTLASPSRLGTRTTAERSDTAFNELATCHARNRKVIDIVGLNVQPSRSETITMASRSPGASGAKISNDVYVSLCSNRKQLRLLQPGDTAGGISGTPERTTSQTDSLRQDRRAAHRCGYSRDLDNQKARCRSLTPHASTVERATLVVHQRTRARETLRSVVDCGVTRCPVTLEERLGLITQPLSMVAWR